MKKILISLFTVLLLISMVRPISANNSTVTTYVDEVFEDGSYIEIVIEQDVNLARLSSTSGSKTANYKDSDGTILWTLQVKGAFNYTGTTAQCTNAVSYVTINSSSWKLNTKSASRSENKATATCTVDYYILGINTKSITRSVTLTCSPDGVLS